jgi:hypothetical protein
MIRHTILTVLLAMMLVTAGCATQVTPGEDSGTGTDATTGTATDAGSDAGSAGKVSVYVSDEQNAIDQFEHLNVTITKVGLHRAEGDADAAENGEDDGAAAGGWVEQDVDNRTVDLTNYLGAAATKLTDVDAPNGEYDKVFVYVSEVNGTLKNGEQVTVKLPSNKLHINAEFAVGSGEQVDFVYDLTVFEAGKSGKYVLKPVVSESGTSDQVDIEKTDEADETNESDSTDQSTDAALNVSLDGPAVAGENVTVTVTQNGSAVANATVKANGEAVGETGSDGTLVVSVPADAEELELEVEHEDSEGELTVAVAAEGGSGEADATPTETETGSLAAPPA